MSIRAEIKNDVSLLYIDGEMTIYTAAELKTQLQDHLANFSDIQIDLFHVTEIDCAGLQLLILAKRESFRLGANMQLAQHSPATSAIFDQCNLAAFFGSPFEHSQLSYSGIST